MLSKFNTLYLQSIYQNEEGFQIHYMIQRIHDRIYELINALHEQSTYQVSKIIFFF